MRFSRADSIRQCWDRLNPGVESPQPSEVRRVCVLLSASRSGSSFLFHLLSRHSSVVSPLGEETPFYKLAGLGWVNGPEQSDRIHPDEIAAEKLREIATWILRDAGQPAFDRKRVSPSDAVFRLLLQWPFLCEDLDSLFQRAAGIAGKELDADSFWRALLAELQNTYPQIRPEIYDFPGTKPRVSGFLPELEDPPYVIPKPRDRATGADLGSKLLILKSSFNAYRIPLLKRLFPNAEISAIHLTRNPAGSINGLMDGWQSEAFHSHRLEGIAELAIEGYSRPEAPETRSWWKFDLPPGWGRMTRAPLEEVCAFQWTSANRTILRDIPELDRSLRIRYENLLDTDGLKNELRSIFEFLGLSLAELDFVSKDPAQVMAVNPPGKGKWKARRERILPLLAEKDVREIALQLGYDLTNPETLP